MISGHFEDFVKAMDAMNILSKVKAPQKEECLRKLAKFSRFVTPCPDILNGAFDAGERKCEIPGSSLTKRPDDKCLCQDCEESSGSSDESYWETVKAQTTNNNGQRWKNLLEYEESLIKSPNHRRSSKRRLTQSQQNNLPMSPSTSQQASSNKIDPITPTEDVVKTLNSIKTSLQRLQSQRSDTAIDKFGQYIAHRLHEMSKENRALAEMEIGKVLLKYMAKQFQEEVLTDSLSDDTEENT